MLKLFADKWKREMLVRGPTSAKVSWFDFAHHDK